MFEFVADVRTPLTPTLGTKNLLCVVQTNYRAGTMTVWAGPTTQRVAPLRLTQR